MPQTAAPSPHHQGTPTPPQRGPKDDQGSQTQKSSSKCLFGYKPKISFVFFNLAPRSKRLSGPRGLERKKKNHCRDYCRRRRSSRQSPKLPGLPDAISSKLMALMNLNQPAVSTTEIKAGFFRGREMHAPFAAALFIFGNRQNIESSKEVNILTLPGRSQNKNLKWGMDPSTDQSQRHTREPAHKVALY